MSWNYRIIHHDTDAEPWYGLHEVYYDGDGSVMAWTKDAARFSAYTLQGVQESLLWARGDARKRPVLLESQALLEAGRTMGIGKTAGSRRGAAMTHAWVFPLPPDSLRTNRRMGQHYGPVQKARKAYHAACTAAVVAAGLLGEDRGGYPVHLYVTAFLGPRQRADASDVGGWGKTAIDVLVEMGVLRGDGSASVNPFTASVRTDDRQHPRLEVWWD